MQLKRQQIVFATLAWLAVGSCATRAQPISLKEQLIGTWTTVSQYTILKDGQREELYGSKPIGSLMFDRNDRFSYILFNPARPKFASGDKAKGTADEYQAAVVGGQAYFGTFTISDTGDRIIYHIEGSLEPSWQGTNRTAMSVKLVGDELTYNATTPATGATAYQVWHRVK